MRTYHALYNPPKRRARRPAAKPARKRVRKCNPRSRFPNLKRKITSNPGIDTVSEGVDFIKEVSRDEVKGGAADWNVHRSKTLAPLKYILLKPGQTVEVFGRVWEGDASGWRWYALDTVGAVFDEGTERNSNAAINAANSAIESFAEPAIRAYVARVLDASSMGTGSMAEKDRETLLEHFELQSFTPEGYETPLPGNYADRPVPNMPGYVIRVYAAWANTLTKPYAGKKAYWFQVLDPDGNAVGGKSGSGPLTSKKGKLEGFKDIELEGSDEDIALDVFEERDEASDGWHPATAGLEDNPAPSQNAKKDAAEGMMGPFATSLEANQAADLVAAIFSGERDVHVANPTQRRRLTSGARKHFAKRNPAGSVFDAEALGATGKEPALGIGPMDAPSARSKLWKTSQRLAKSVFGDDASDLTVQEGGVQEDELGSFEQVVGVPSNDPAATFRMGYYYGILRGINSCKIKDYFKREQFRRRFERRIIEAYNKMAQSAIKDAKNVKVRKTI